MLPGSQAIVDLENAYFSVQISEDHKRFLRFWWRSVIYEFTALPFGLSTTPFIFIKILRPVVAHLHSKGY